MNQGPANSSYFQEEDTQNTALAMFAASTSRDASPEGIRNDGANNSLLNNRDIMNSTTSVDPNNSLTTVNKLNSRLYTKLQVNASALGKRFTHKSAPRVPPSNHTSGMGHYAVSHHRLSGNGFDSSSQRSDQAAGRKNALAIETTGAANGHENLDDA